MAAITICSDFGAPKNKVWQSFHCFPIYLPWSDGTRCHDLSFLNVELFHDDGIILKVFLLPSQEQAWFLFLLRVFQHLMTTIMASAPWALSSPDGQTPLPPHLTKISQGLDLQKKRQPRQPTGEHAFHSDLQAKPDLHLLRQGSPFAWLSGDTQGTWETSHCTFRSHEKRLNFTEGCNLKQCWILLNCSFCFGRFGVGPGILNCKQAPGWCRWAGLEATLWAASC